MMEDFEGRDCDGDCQCSGLITENFKIHSENGNAKRRRHDSKLSKMSSQLSEFNSPIKKSPFTSRNALSSIENRLSSPINKDYFKSSSLNTNFMSSPINLTPNSHRQTPNSHRQTPNSHRQTPNSTRLTSNSNLWNKTPSKGTNSKILRILEDRNKFNMAVNKENQCPNVFLTDEETLMSFESPKLESVKKRPHLDLFGLSRISHETPSKTQETPKKLDFDSLSRDSGFEPSGKKLYPDDSTSEFDSQTSSTSKMHYYEDSIMSDLDVTLTDSCQKNLVPDKDHDDFESLHDLEAEFDSDIFDKCTNYEIISTDSPNIITRGSNRKIKCTNFNFGAPLAESEPSTSFDLQKSNNATRMLNFDNFASPADIKASKQNGGTVKKSLSFNTPTKSYKLKHESSESSIGTMSPNKMSPKLSRKNSCSSGFMSEIEDSFIFDNLSENDSGSPKMTGLGDLICGQIKLESDINDRKTDIVRRPAFGRSLSLNPDAYMSPTEKLRIKLGRSNIESPRSSKFMAESPTFSPKRPFKRPEPPVVLVEDAAKRRKSSKLDEFLSPVSTKNNFRPVLQRAFSESHASIMMALNRSASEPDLIGDFSRSFALPLTPSKHSDLRSISSETLADLLEGKYENDVSDFKVIDCRYPYEYTGGHIKGATNLYSKEQVMQFLASAECTQRTDDLVAVSKDTEISPEKLGRRILVFHCEFSLERGPTLFRYLRSSDRARNKDNYPNLNYPEIYLLHEGYEAFYSKFSHLCEPRSYTPMLDPTYTNQLKVYRNENSKLRKCVSVDEGSKRTLQRQRSKSRLLL